MGEKRTMAEAAEPASPPALAPRLLRTKLYVPRAHPDLVPRDRLARRLDEGQACRLTLLSAPAGSGKTTLLGDWLQRRGLHPAWVSLDAGDNEPRRFWSYVVAALDTVHAGLGRAAAELLSLPQPPPIEAILTDLTNDITALLDAAAEPGNRLILILDDYHAIQAPSIHQALEFFLLNLPPGMRLIVASREDPPLPLALLRARRELVELRAADLRFTAGEAAAFLNTCMGLNLTAESLAALEARTEGWAAGLQLAAMSMQGVEDAAGFIRAFTGSHRYVFDYLAQEVLAQQPAPVRDFLLHTAILDRLCGPLCDAVTGGSDGQAMLERLEQANLFLLPLDHERHWYRYHALFAEFLHEQLARATGEERLAELHRRAAAWYERQGSMDEAVQHALHARDFEAAVRLVDACAEEMFVRSELVTLCGWLAALPEETIAARPRLSMLYAWALVATAHPEEAERWVEAIERRVGAGVDALAGPEAARLAPEVRAALVEVSVLRSTLAMGRGDLPRVLELLQRVLPYLEAEGQPYVFNTPRALHPAALFTLAIAHELGGDLAAASPAFARAAELALEDENHHLLPMALSHLAQIQIVQGKLHQAEKTYRQALDTSEKIAVRASPLAGMAYVGLGRLLYEWNELDAAGSYLARGIALGRPWLNWESLVPGYLTLTRLKRAQGDQAGAAEALDAFFNLEGLPFPPQAVSGIAAYEALFQARWGDIEAAARWAADSDIDPGHEVPPIREEEAIILARVWIAEGRRADAERLLARLREAAQAGGRTGRLIEVLVLQALALYGQGQDGPALRALRQALSLAEPEGWVRVFVDEGEPMAEMLSRVGEPGAYVARLTAAFSPPPAGRAASATAVTVASPQPLIEPLTDRELEVLQLIAQGLSNRQIAARLVVSVNTVKTHAKNLNAKLDAANRTQAVARARELGLLRE
jgi:LuxR family maltose regulon positive regulatory protein